MPAATIWKAVADVLTEGLHHIPPSAQHCGPGRHRPGASCWRCCEWRTRNRFPLSPVGIGLGFVIPFNTCLSMFIGSFIFWLAGVTYPHRESKVNQIVVQNMEPICAGLIAGGRT